MLRFHLIVSHHAGSISLGYTEGGKSFSAGLLTSPPDFLGRVRGGQVDSMDMVNWLTTTAVILRGAIEATGMGCDMDVLT